MKHKKKSKRSWKNDKDSSSNSHSDSESDLDGDGELDLVDYAGDCIKLMSEVFKVLGDKKLKKMTPTVLKPISTDNLKACLVEECMALSKKRIISIVNGEIYSSSSETEEDLPKITDIKKEIDIISLESISDDSDIICFEGRRSPELEPLKKSKENRKKRQNVDSTRVMRKKHKKKIKTEAPNEIEKKRVKKKNDVEPVIEEKAMTALELLELQARARAIKSQLMLETAKSNTEEDVIMVKKEDDAHVANNDPEENSPDGINFGASTSISLQDVTENSKPKKVKLRRDHHMSGASIIQVPKFKTHENIEQDLNLSTETMEQTLEISVHKNTDEIVSITLDRKAPPQRHGSSDSLIIESPSHPLIVLSSEDEANSSVHLEKSNSKRIGAKIHSVKHKEQPGIETEISSTHQTKDENNVELIEVSENNLQTLDEQESEKIIDKDISTEDGEIQDDKEVENNEDVAVITFSKDYEKKTVETEEIKSTNALSNEPQVSTENLNESVDLDCIIIDSEPDFESESEMLNEASDKPENESSLINNENLTWKTRWLGSKRVQNVLQTSKIYNSMKRKLTSRKEQSAKSSESNEESVKKLMHKDSKDNHENHNTDDSPKVAQ